jgi:hypothetical protein
MALMVAVVGAATVAKAESVKGLWRGSGFVNPSEGRRQRYQLTARCATASANIDQVGEVRRTGRNRLSGSFYNADVNVRGRIQITVSGNQQVVTLISDAGSGRLTLFKR